MTNIYFNKLQFQYQIYHRIVCYLNGTFTHRWDVQSDYVYTQNIGLKNYFIFLTLHDRLFQTILYKSGGLYFGYFTYFNTKGLSNELFFSSLYAAMWPEMILWGTQIQSSLIDGKDTRMKNIISYTYKTDI